MLLYWVLFMIVSSFSASNVGTVFMPIYKYIWEIYILKKKLLVGFVILLLVIIVKRVKPIMKIVFGFNKLIKNRGLEIKI